MERPSYPAVANAIAHADTPEEKQAAACLAANYYAVEPYLETLPVRRTLLKAALLSALERERRKVPSGEPDAEWPH